MRPLSCFGLAVLLLSTASSSAVAEKAPMSKEQLLRTATHAVTGDVVAVYQRTEEVGDWKYTRFVAEIRVKQSEKGDGVSPGQLIYVRYWRRGWIGATLQPPSTGGHRGLPEAGDAVRVYLAKNAYDGFTRDNNDGGFNVIGTNGFEKLTE